MHEVIQLGHYRAVICLENSKPRDDWAEGREVSGGLRSRREMGQVGWVVPGRNGAGVRMGLLGGEGECVSLILHRGEPRLREGQAGSEVTQLREAEQRINKALALAWLLGQDKLALTTKT